MVALPSSFSLRLQFTGSAVVGAWATGKLNSTPPEKKAPLIARGANLMTEFL
jgi:hypothetical protein